LNLLIDLNFADLDAIRMEGEYTHFKIKIKKSIDIETLLYVLR
jgi:hypothetical protein